MKKGILMFAWQNKEKTEPLKEAQNNKIANVAGSV